MSAKRNKVIEKKYLNGQQEEMVTDKKKLELENRLKMSEKRYEEYQKERINFFKRYSYFIFTQELGSLLFHT